MLFTNMIRRGNARPDINANDVLRPTTTFHPYALDFAIIQHAPERIDKYAVSVHVHVRVRVHVHVRAIRRVPISLPSTHRPPSVKQQWKPGSERQRTMSERQRTTSERQRTTSERQRTSSERKRTPAAAV